LDLCDADGHQRRLPEATRTAKAPGRNELVKVLLFKDEAKLAADAESFPASPGQLMEVA